MFCFRDFNAKVDCRKLTSNAHRPLNYKNGYIPMPIGLGDLTTNNTNDSFQNFHAVNVSTFHKMTHN